MKLDFDTTAMNTEVNAVIEDINGPVSDSDGQSEAVQSPVPKRKKVKKAKKAKKTSSKKKSKYTISSSSSSDPEFVSGTEDSSDSD